MKTTSDPMVSIVNENGDGASVPRSAFEKVWAHRGYRLASDVEAEQAAAEAEEEGDEAADESAGKTPDSGDAGSPPPVVTPPVPGPRGHVNPAS